MIPPKYNFYIGRLTSSYGLTDNKSINATTGQEINLSGQCVSFNIYVNNSSTIYINANRTTGLSQRVRIYCYDGSGVYLGMIYTVCDETVALKKDTVLVRLSFSMSISNDIYSKMSNNISVVYSMHGINPHYKELNKKYAKESGQEFFRILLDGKISLFGDGYELIKNSSLESQLLFFIDKYNGVDNWSKYYKGEFNKTDCKFDHDRKSCELKVSTNDAYSNVINGYSNTYDLIKLAPAITKIGMHKRSLMQVYVKGANSITNFFGGTYWEDDVNEAVDSHNDLVNKYYFAYIKTGNEFYVRNAGISAVNGVYAGINGNWHQWNGYTCYTDAEPPMPGYIYIRRNSDNAILYKSVKQLSFITDANDRYLTDENIEMVNVNNEYDKFTIESPFIYPIYRRLLCDVNSIEDSEGIKNTYDLPIDDFVTDNRNYKKCIGLKGGLFFCTSEAIDEPTKYGLNDYGKYFTNRHIPHYGITGISGPLPISRNSWANASLWFVYDNGYTTFEEKLRKKYTLKDSYSIADTIKVLLKEIDPMLKHEATAEYSRFLYDTTQPITADRFYVYITQKTNVLKGEYDQPAQKAEISLEDIMKMLRDCFRCYWYIENNKFKIEHISFFMNGGSYSYSPNVQLDLTNLADQFNKKPSAYFQSEVDYDKTNLNHRYEFNWMDSATDLFSGLTIDVNSKYVQQDKTEDISISQFSSDVDYMLFNPSNFSNDGFALLCPGKVNLYKTTMAGLYINPNGSIEINSSIDSCQLQMNPGQVYSIIQQSSELYIRVFRVVDSKYIQIYYTNNVSELDYTCPNDGNAYVLQCEEYNTKPGNTEIRTLELPIIKTQLIDGNNTYGAIIQNFWASWAYLARFYMYDMPATNIKCNVVNNLYVNSIKKCMNHSLEFPAENDLNEMSLIKTSIGNGKIDEISINIDTRLAKVKLVYEPI